MSHKELHLKLRERVICQSDSYTSNWGRVICHSKSYTSNWAGESLVDHINTPQGMGESDLSLQELRLPLGERVICQSGSYTSNWGRE